MSEQNEKKEGSCCTSSGACCGCKKFFMGILVGLLIAVLAHCFLGGGYCHKSKGMCPMMQQQMPMQTK